MLEELLEEITPQDLFDFARAVPVPEEFVFTRQFMRTREIPGIRWATNSRKRRTATAKYRSWDAETARGRRVVERLRTEGELPPVSIKFVIGEREQIMLDAIRSGDISLLVEEVYDDTAASVLAIYARMEQAAGATYATGVTPIDDDDFKVDIEWGVPEEHLPTAPVFWDNPAANIIDQEEDQVRLLVSKGKGRPGAAVSSDRVYSVLGANAQYRQSYFGSTENSYRNLIPTEVDSVRAARRLPPLTLADHVIDDHNGVPQRVFPDNRVLYLPADTSEVAESQYGITAEALTLRSGGQLTIERQEESGVIVTRKVDDDPIAITTRGTATAMPVVYDGEGFVSLQVLDD